MSRTSTSILTKTASEAIKNKDLQALEQAVKDSCEAVNDAILDDVFSVINERVKNMETAIEEYNTRSREVFYDLFLASETPVRTLLEYATLPVMNGGIKEATEKGSDMKLRRCICNRVEKMVDIADFDAYSRENAKKSFFGENWLPMIEAFAKEVASINLQGMVFDNAEHKKAVVDNFRKNYSTSQAAAKMTLEAKFSKKVETANLQEVFNAIYPESGLIATKGDCYLLNAWSIGHGKGIYSVSFAGASVMKKYLTELLIARVNELDPQVEHDGWNKEKDA